MAMPELPEGYEWRVSRKLGRESVAVKLVMDSSDQEYVDMRLVSTDIVGRQSTNEARELSKERFIAYVEEAARDIIDLFKRNIYIDQVLEESWPQS